MGAVQHKTCNTRFDPDRANSTGQHQNQLACVWDNMEQTSEPASIEF